MFYNSIKNLTLTDGFKPAHKTEHFFDYFGSWKSIENNKETKASIFLRKS